MNFVRRSGEGCIGSMIVTACAWNSSIYAMKKKIEIIMIKGALSVVHTTIALFGIRL
jgi:hypothetical protein